MLNARRRLFPSQKSHNHGQVGKRGATSFCYQIVYVEAQFSGLDLKLNQLSGSSWPINISDASYLCTHSFPEIFHAFHTRAALMPLSCGALTVNHHAD
jgi:hypothetical protein